MLKNRICKCLALAMCVLFMLCCLFGAVLSHDHKCRDDDCIVCTLIDLMKSVFAVMLVSITVIKSVRSENPAFEDKTLSIKCDTPVMNKVKLTP